MKRKNAKFWALVLVMAPGMSMLSCSGTLFQEFRDALIQGAAGAIETAATNAVANWLPGAGQ
ncbi:MAG: hypothetical protein PVI86_08650 [Phycisphaerae bacterium]|jgi:hypothetical protein